MYFLELKSIGKAFIQGASEVNVLLNINIKIKEEEIVAVVGPSGSGKSTLLKIAGLLDGFDRGSIYFENMDCSKLTDYKRTLLRRKMIGFVYQSYNLLPEFTALENLLMPQLIAGKCKKDAVKNARMFLSILKMTGKENNYPAELSGGEQQRIAIARGLINNPKLLLADEPTGNLDQENSQNVFKLIYDITKKQHAAALVVTHDLKLAKKADRVFLLKEGKLVILGESNGQP